MRLGEAQTFCSDGAGATTDAESSTREGIVKGRYGLGLSLPGFHVNHKVCVEGDGAHIAEYAATMQ